MVKFFTPPSAEQIASTKPMCLGANLMSVTFVLESTREVRFTQWLWLLLWAAFPDSPTKWKEKNGMKIKFKQVSFPLMAYQFLPRWQQFCQMSMLQEFVQIPDEPNWPSTLSQHVSSSQLYISIHHSRPGQKPVNSLKSDYERDVLQPTSDVHTLTLWSEEHVAMRLP